MHCAGPFWRQRPTAATVCSEWGWCYIYLDSQGRVSAIEWLSR